VKTSNAAAEHFRNHSQRQFDLGIIAQVLRFLVNFPSLPSFWSSEASLLAVDPLGAGGPVGLGGLESGGGVLGFLDPRPDPPCRCRRGHHPHSLQ
jgi:hypothetical protein